MAVTRVKPGSVMAEDLGVFEGSVVDAAETPPLFAPYATRCARIKRNGEQCKKAAMTGLTVCLTHGGNLPANAAKSQRAKVRGALDKFVKPISADDKEADPIVAFEVEFRRTVARIRYFDEQIAKLEDANALVWGMTSQERKDGFEKGDVVTTTTTVHEAKMNGYVEAQWQERRHLKDLTKIWIGAKLDERRLNIMESTVLMLNDAITAIVRGLGKDVNDPEVRQVVRAALVALPGVETMTGASS